MKNLLFIISGSMLLFAGCSQQNEKTSSQLPLESSIQRDVNEVWEGQSEGEVLPDFLGDPNSWGAFPESMVGVWEAKVGDTKKWGIKFEQDGSISKIIHSVAGPVNVTEGGASAGTDEIYYIFVMGPCEAKYIKKTRMIKVKIILDYFIIKLPAGELEGRAEDYFAGPVSEDGKTWNANWQDFGFLKGGSPPPIEFLKANPQPMVFNKIDLTKIQEKKNTN